MSAPGRAPFSAASGRLLWFLAIAFVFAVGQQTLRIYPTYITSVALPNALIALLWIFGLAGAGANLNAWLLGARKARPDLFLGLASGLGLAGGLVYVFALCGLLGSSFFAALLGLCWLGAADSYRRLFSDWRKPAFLGHDRTPRIPRWLALFASLGMSLLMLAYASLPPSFYDSLVNHLALPQQYLQNGGYVAFPHHLMSYYPHLHEWLLCLPLAFGGPEAANLFTAFIMLATLGLVARLAWRLGGHLAALFAFALSIGLPMVVYLGSDLKSDSTLAFFMLASFSALCGLRAPRRLLLAGFFFGSACAVKSTALVAAPSLVLAWYALERPRGLAAWRGLGLAGLLAGLVALPHLLPAWIAQGSPFYPQFPEIFGAVAGLDYALLNREIQAMHEFADFPRFLYNLFFNPMAVDADNAVMGVGFLLLLPLLALLRRRRLLWAIALAWVLTLLPLALLSTKLRFFPLFYLLPAILLAAGLARLVKTKPRLVYPAVFVLALLWSHNANLTFQLQSAFFSGAEDVFAGTLRPADFLAQNQPQLKAFREIEAHTAADARILLDGEARFAYLARRVEVSSPYETSELARALARGEAPAATLARLKREGFTAVYIALRKHVGGNLPASQIEALKNAADVLYEDPTGLVLGLRSGAL